MIPPPRNAYSGPCAPLLRVLQHDLVLLFTVETGGGAPVSHSKYKAMRGCSIPGGGFPLGSLGMDLPQWVWVGSGRCPEKGTRIPGNTRPYSRAYVEMF